MSKQTTKRFAYFHALTGVVEQVLSIPEAMAEPNCQQHQYYIELSPDAEVTPGECRIKDGAIIDHQPDVDRIVLERQIRVERNRRLAQTDWTQFEDTPVDPEPWRIYRQALRDLFDTINMADLTSLDDVVWPKPPGA